ADQARCGCDRRTRGVRLRHQPRTRRSAHTGHEGADHGDDLSRPVRPGSTGDRRSVPMTMNLRERVTTTFQKRIANPVMRRMPFQTLLETTGRVSGKPRRTPLDGRREGNTFWFVSEFGEKSDYVKNIKAD